MASLARRLEHNVAGDFFVDASCIDCDTCRWMAPGTFRRRHEQASVFAQPSEPVELLRAQMALLSCPTGSIGSTERHDLTVARAALPDAIDDAVYHCGYHHQGSFGAASYLIRRTDGNVLVDSPRFTNALVRRLEDLGGVRWLFLTHQDDIADHSLFARHFACQRILHRHDVDVRTKDIELVLDGLDPVAIAPDLLVIPAPGHTRGSACLLHAETHLFTGDHAAWSQRLDHVYAFADACWYDWPTQIESMRRLLDHRFSWLLPGHGRRCHFPAATMRSQIARAVAWMESVTARS